MTDTNIKEDELEWLPASEEYYQQLAQILLKHFTILTVEGEKQAARSVFHGVPLNCSLTEFLLDMDEILRSWFGNPELLLVALYYVIQLSKTNRIEVHTQNIHALFLASCLIAIKFMEDGGIETAYYAQQFQLPARAMFRLEQEFLFLNQFHLFITPRHLHQDGLRELDDPDPYTTTDDEIVDDLYTVIHWRTKSRCILQ